MALKNKGQKYTAIYARISSKNDNNSIDAQIEECKLVAQEKSLIVYDSYIDRISGKSTSPEKRNGFKGLLADAKAGMFKNLIIYRYDRLVRNYNDWINISGILRKLGIKILLADKSQPPCLDNPNDSFLTNLMVLFADFEPDNIKQRVSKGKEVRRFEGIYNAGKYVPFGYKKEITTGFNEFNIKSFFIPIPVVKEFIVHIYEEFYRQTKNNEEDVGYIINELYKNLYKLIDSIDKYIEDNAISDFQDENNSNMRFINSIKNYKINEIRNGINEVKKYFFINEYSNKKNYKNKILAVLKNNIYSGYMLIESNKDKNPFDGFSKNGDGSLYFDIDKFIKTKNIEGIVDLEIFSKTYDFLLRRELEIRTNSRDFLFKGVVKCVKCKGELVLDSNNILACSRGCCSYFYNELIRYFLDIIVDNVIKTDNGGFNNFKTKLDNKILRLNNSLAKSIKEKESSILSFSLAKKQSIDEMNKFLISRNKDIHYQKKILAEYRNKLNDLMEIEDLIKNNMDKDIGQEDDSYHEC